jgi:hypothetical protein
VTVFAARLTPIEGRELRALCMRENDELLVLHRAYEESVQDGIFGESETAVESEAGHMARFAPYTFLDHGPPANIWRHAHPLLLTTFDRHTQSFAVGSFWRI